MEEAGEALVLGSGANAGEQREERNGGLMSGTFSRARSLGQDVTWAWDPALSWVMCPCAMSGSQGMPQDLCGACAWRAARGSCSSHDNYGDI